MNQQQTLQHMSTLESTTLRIRASLLHKRTTVLPGFFLATMAPPSIALLRALRSTEYIRAARQPSPHSPPPRLHPSHLHHPILGTSCPHQSRAFHSSVPSPAQSFPRTTDRGPTSTETTQTDFSTMDVFSNSVRYSLTSTSPPHTYPYPLATSQVHSHNSPLTHTHAHNASIFHLKTPPRLTSTNHPSPPQPPP